MRVHEGESKVNYNNNIQKDFIAKLKERYLFTEDTINSTDEKSRNLRMPENLSGIPTEEDVKNMLKTRLHKKISGSEHSEWQSAKYKTMEERKAMDEKGKEDHIKQGMKVKGLNDFEQCALFLLNESNYCYNTWLKITFLNYLSSNKKQWTDSNKKALGKQEIDKQLNFFEELDNYKIDPKGNKLLPEVQERAKAFIEGIGFKGYILPENEYLLRMIFIDNMIKGIELFYHLLVVGPDKLMRGVKQSKIDKQKRKDLLYSAGVDENIVPVDDDGRRCLKWGKPGIARSKKGGFLTKAGCWIVTKVAFCAFMWAIVANNFSEKVDNFLPEVEHLFQTNFRDYTPRIASDFSETRKVFTEIMLEYSGGITNDEGKIMFGGQITKVPAENIKSEMKRRNTEHLKEIKTLKEMVQKQHEQTIGIIKALPSPEIVSREYGTMVSLTSDQHTLKKEALLKKLNDRKILCCGDGSNAALCQLFVCNLLNHFEQDRPALPAFSLANDAATLTAITSSYSFNETYSKQIHALGQSGDVLLTLSNQKHNGSIIQAIRAAHERKLVVVCLNSSAGTDISSLMLPEDIELVVNAQRPVRITEIHTMLLHHFCELIDFALFGTHSP